MPKFLLVQGSCDYSDEFDCRFLCYMTSDEWEKDKAAAQLYFEENGTAEVYFGTNEWLEFDSYEDWEDCFTVTEISKSTFKEMKAIIPYAFGTGVGIFDLGQ